MDRGSRPGAPAILAKVAHRHRGYGLTDNPQTRVRLENRQVARGQTKRPAEDTMFSSGPHVVYGSGRFRPSRHSQRNPIGAIRSGQGIQRVGGQLS